MGDAETLATNPLYTAGGRLIPPSLSDADFFQVWPTADDDSRLFAEVTTADFQQLEAALENIPLKPGPCWLVLLLRAAHALGRKRDATRYLLYLLTIFHQTLDGVSGDAFAGVRVHLTELFERVEGDVDSSDTTNYDVILQSVARDYRGDGTDRKRLERAVELLNRVTGEGRREALVNLSDAAINLWDLSHSDQYSTMAMRAADEALRLLDPDSNPDWYARALHERGIARSMGRPTPDDLAAAILDLNAAYKIWREKGNPIDRWRNRMATAHVYGMGLGGKGTAITSDGVLGALGCYHEAMVIVREQYADGGRILLNNLHKFLRRILAGPFFSRLDILELVWKGLSEMALKNLYKNGYRLDGILPGSLWIPRETIPSTWTIPSDGFPQDLPTVTRYMLIRQEYAWANLAMLIVSHGLEGPLMAQLSERLKTNPIDADACYQLGVLYLFKKAPAQARTLFSQALQERPDWAVVEELLGTV